MHFPQKTGNSAFRFLYNILLRLAKEAMKFSLSTMINMALISCGKNRRYPVEIISSRQNKYEMSF